MTTHTPPMDPPNSDPKPDPNHSPNPNPNGDSTPNAVNTSSSEANTTSSVNGSSSVANTSISVNGSSSEANTSVSVNGSSSEANTANSVNGSSPGKSQKSVRWSENLVSESTYTPAVDPDTPVYSDGSYPYAAHSHSPSSSPSLSSSASFKDKMDSVRNVLGKWGRNVKDAAKKAEDLAGNTLQHLKTSPSLADAAMGRIVHSTKVLAEGGYEKIFRQTFETLPEELLQDSFACYLSTSAGPVMGTLYISTDKLAFCSDNPLPYKNGDLTEWSYYKVVIPLHQLKAVNPSSSRVNPAEKYIQIISVDNHEFWYMGFLNYDDAVNILNGALLSRNSQSV